MVQDEFKLVKTPHYSIMYVGKNFTSYLLTVIILGPHHNLPHHLTPLGSREECFTIFDDESTQYKRACQACVENSLFCFISCEHSC